LAAAAEQLFPLSGLLRPPPSLTILDRHKTGATTSSPLDRANTSQDELPCRTRAVWKLSSSRPSWTKGSQTGMCLGLCLLCRVLVCISSSALLIRPDLLRPVQWPVPNTCTTTLNRRTGKMENSHNSHMRGRRQNNEKLTCFDLTRSPARSNLPPRTKSRSPSAQQASAAQISTTTSTDATATSSCSLRSCWAMSLRAPSLRSEKM
jgi:hypothetical protein